MADFAALLCFRHATQLMRFHLPLLDVADMPPCCRFCCSLSGAMLRHARQRTLTPLSSRHDAAADAAACYDKMLLSATIMLPDDAAMLRRRRHAALRPAAADAAADGASPRARCC